MSERSYERLSASSIKAHFASCWNWSNEACAVADLIDNGFEARRR